MASAPRYDLITFGGGLAGLVTAARAAQLGLRVAVLEKATEDKYLCSSRYGTGVIVAMGRSILSDPDDIAAAIMAATDGTARPELARMLASNARRAAEWLRGEGAQLAEEDTSTGRNIVLLPRRRFKEGLDWEGKALDLLLGRLEQNIRDRGGAMLRGTEVKSLLMADGACVGVRAIGAGQAAEFRSDAVVIADGGYQANPEILRRLLFEKPDRVLLRAATLGGMGDGIVMAEDAGAATGGFGAFYGHIHHRDAMDNGRLWPYPHFDAVAAVSVLVDRHGHRFTDEGLGGVCMANAIAKLDDPLSTFVVFDDAIWNGTPGRALPVPVNPFLMEGRGWMHSADTIDGLARLMAVPATSLRETIEGHNEAVSGGPLQNVQPRRTTAKHLPMAIAAPPYHAVPLCAGITLTMGGIHISERCQALRSDGTPIRGLYVAGTPVAGLEGGPRAGYIGGLCKAITLGVVAAESAAATAGRSVTRDL